MPWPEDHKSQTRARIVKAAAVALRKSGVSGVSVARIMAEAGQTHGGFYAHFASKGALLGAAMEEASRETLQTLAKALEAVPTDRHLHAIAEAYLSSKHVEHPERGCPLAALGSELARIRGPAKRDVARAVDQRIVWLQSLLPE